MTDESIRKFTVLLGRTRAFRIPPIFSMDEMENAYAAMAESLGVTVAKLSEADKKQAVMNAMLRGAG